MRSLLWLTVMLVSLPALAQHDDLIDISLKPFWKSKIMYNESVMMVSKDGKQPESRLLFKPRRILSVSNSGLDTVYKEHVDWEYKDGRIVLLPGSKAVFMTDSQLNADSAKKFFPKKGGGRVLHQEGDFFHQHQLAVTYKHRRNEWKGLIPVFKPDALPVTIDALRNKKPVRILLYGDSIAAGANSSGRAGADPKLPDWGTLVVEKLKRHYQGNINFTNTAVGGKTSKWGLETIKENVIAHSPDLVILAFGMNDGTGKLDPQKFKDNISGMISQVRESNKNAEFILIATMLPNPESLFEGTQPEFAKVLDELVAPGITMVDMSAVHRELLKHKSYQDMTGNNINHPNDFLIRWYAQEILGVLIDQGY